MSVSGLDLRTLEAFLAVIDHQSFSAAARALGVTQSAVSLRIKGLEQALGAQLLERQGHTSRPTTQGAALVTHARTIVDLINATPSVVSGSISGQLIVGAVPTVLLGLLPLALASLRDAYPDLHLTVRGGGSVQLAADLATHATDVAILTEPSATPDGLCFMPIASEPLMALVPEHLARQHDQPRLEALITRARPISGSTVTAGPAARSMRICGVWASGCRRSWK
jgi:DNA-binding transcriptional LysR family regulator